MLAGLLDMQEKRMCRPDCHVHINAATNFGFSGDAAEAPRLDSSLAQIGDDDEDADAEEAAMTDLLTCLGLE